MRERSCVFLAVAMMYFVFASLASANGWQLKDMGVGIYDDAAYDTELRIVEKRNTWSMKELQSRGALSGRGKVFGAWLSGPPVNTYLNQGGQAEYLYKYRLTDPKGQSTVSGPHGFYMPGFTTVFINTWIAGNWKIEFMIWSRSTGQEKSVGSINFIITEADATQPAPAGWSLKDMGVGIYDDAAYDTELRIVEKRNTWSMKELQSRGALSGRGKVFGAWLSGPPVNTYLNENGVAKYLYKYRLTDPKGQTMLSGPHGFYSPGFTTIFINTWITGNWKVEFLIWQRSTGKEVPVGTIDFKITD
jgi:hypothetical protein